MKLPAAEFTKFIDSLIAFYPEDVFVPPTSEEWSNYHKVLKAAGLSLDTISGDIIRRSLRLAKNEFKRRQEADAEEFVFLKMSLREAWELKQALCFCSMVEGIEGGDAVNVAINAINDELEEVKKRKGE